MHPREFHGCFRLRDSNRFSLNFSKLFNYKRGKSIFNYAGIVYLRERGWERRQRSLETSIESTLRNMYPSANPKCLYNFNQFRIIKSAWTGNRTQHVVCSSRIKSFTLVLRSVSIVFATTIQKEANDPIKF